MTNYEQLYQQAYHAVQNLWEPSTKNATHYHQVAEQIATLACHQELSLHDAYQTWLWRK